MPSDATRTATISPLASAANGTEEDVLSATKLRDVRDNELLPFLFATHRHLRVKRPPFHVDPAFVEQLLTPRLLRSAMSDVAQMVGCLLCDIIRLVGGASRPFPRSASAGVLRCLARPFQEVVEANESGGGAADRASLQRCACLIERASASRALFYLITDLCEGGGGGAESIDPTALQDLLQVFFSAVGCASGGKTTTQNGGGGGGGSAISRGTAGEMAGVLNDILAATTVLTEAQLRPLLRELILASGALRASAERSSLAGASSDGLRGGLHATAGGGGGLPPPGASIAAQVLLAQGPIAQPVIASFAMGFLERGVAELLAATVVGEAGVGAGLPAKMEAKRHALREVSRALEVLVVMMELHADLVRELLPGLVPYLQHDRAELRLITLRGVAAAFMANPSAFTSYPAAFSALGMRLSDTKPALRVEMLQLVARLVGGEGPDAAVRRRERWEALAPALRLRLTDPHVMVRTQCVRALVEIAHAAPGLFDDAAAGEGDRQGGGAASLAAALGMRTVDKHPRVRAAAVEGLCGVYRHHRLGWIPAAVVHATHAEDGLRLVERHFEGLLPPPSRGAGEGGSSPAIEAPSRAPPAPTLAVFDFETAAPSPDGRAYVAGFVRLLADLPAGQFPILLAMFTAKPSLRRAITRLFELRAELRELANPPSAAGEAVVRGVHRLLQFLNTTTGAHWDGLFRAKDEQIPRAFLQLCAATNVEWGEERQRFLRGMKGRVDGEVFGFLEGTLVRQVALPIGRVHLDELLTWLRARFPPSATGDGLEGGLRTLLVFLAAAPSFAPVVARALPGLLASLPTSGEPRGGGTPKGGKKETPAKEGVEDARRLGEAVRLLLQAMAGCAAAVEDAAKPRVGRALIALATTTMPAIRGACHPLPPPPSSSSAGFSSAKADPPDAADANAALLRLAGRIAKGAARAVIALGVGDDVRTLRERLHAALRARSSGVGEMDEVGWLSALRVLTQAGDPFDDALHDAITARLLAVAPRGGVVATAVVEGAARWLSAAARSRGTPNDPNEGDATGRNAEKDARGVAHALDALLRGFRLVCGEGGSRRGGAAAAARARRLAICKQLAKLLVYPSAEIGKELATAAIFSAERDSAVRQPLQRKLAAHLIRHPGCDMRYAAFLILTAVSEEGKASYAALRELLYGVAAHLQQLQAAQPIPLSSPVALTRYLEYSIPFLVLFMAHHPFFEHERANHFIGFQRAWHLLFEALFRTSTQGASFVVELLERMKEAEDALDREGGGSVATRMLCDLGSQVMFACLGQRQIPTEALQRYPGAVLLPSFFVKPGNRAEGGAGGASTTVFLDSKVHIFASAPFKAPPTAGGGGRERSGSRHPTPRESAPRELRETEKKNEKEEVNPKEEKEEEEAAAEKQNQRAVGGSAPPPAGILPPSLPPAATTSASGGVGGSARKRPRDSRGGLPPPFSSPSPSSSSVSTAIRAVVDAALCPLIGGLRKAEIARLRWRVVRGSLEAALQKASPTSGWGAAGEVMEEAVAYAKEQLRVRYEQAEA